MKAKKIIGKLLLAFVLVSVGFALGKETSASKGRSPVGAAEGTATVGGDKVIVYYMHASFRCTTCNLIESMGEELVRTEFADAVRAVRLEWKPVNYQEDEQLATRYKVGGNMIVVARFHDGKEVESRRLDRVMELANNRDEFMAYIRGAIRELMEAKS
jgi:hypothetical protein